MCKFGASVILKLSDWRRIFLATLISGRKECPGKRRADKKKM